jgi:hypothetical protein
LKSNVLYISSVGCNLSLVKVKLHQYLIKCHSREVYEEAED